MGSSEMGTVMQAAMAGASLAVREQEKVRAVFTRFLDLRKDEPNASAVEHARRAMAEVQVLITELSHDDKPPALPANVPLDIEAMETL